MMRGGLVIGKTHWLDRGTPKFLSRGMRRRGARIGPRIPRQSIMRKSARGFAREQCSILLKLEHFAYSQMISSAKCSKVLEKITFMTHRCRLIETSRSKISIDRNIEIKMDRVYPKSS
jgi:hypothetical protein